jgi:predicted DNA-binding protein with PD1-like motif
MKYATLTGDDDGTRTFVVVGEEGEDAFELLSAFAKDHDITAAQLTGVGAFSGATVGWFDREQKDYRRIEVDEQCELLSLIGDIALADDGPQLHAHVVLGLSDGTVRGGHLLAGHVWPTLEVVIRDAPVDLRKTSHPDLGLALIDPPRTDG